MKKIKLLSTGGTIAGEGKNRLDLKDYVPGSFKGEEILKKLPEILDIAKVDVEQISNLGSSNITMNDWIKLKQKIEHALNEEEYDGLVITHGTGTLEETAYFLHLTVNSEKPIVMVGAQRPITSIGSDAPLNLFNAFKVVISPSSVGKGVLVVMNDRIHDARNVTKSNTYRVESFQSGSLGSLGFVQVDHSVRYYTKPLRKHTVESIFSKLDIKQLPNVAMFYSFAGSEGDLINYAVNSGKYDGIIFAGTGGGHGSSKEVGALLNAATKGITVVRSSRVGGGGEVLKLNKEKWANMVMGDNLQPQKARVLLMLSLLVTKDINEIQEIFNEY